MVRSGLRIGFFLRGFEGLLLGRKIKSALLCLGEVCFAFAER